MSAELPERWLQCPKKGAVIEMKDADDVATSRFLPFKVPLDSRFSASVGTISAVCYCILLLSHLAVFRGGGGALHRQCSGLETYFFIAFLGRRIPVTPAQTQAHA